MRKRPGIFIALDGIDGSGKATQAKLLARRIRARRKVRVIDFPQYGKKSAGAIEEYLNGKYGSVARVRPEVASYFYAVDRYDASFTIRAALKRGEVVIADRYVAANIGHQGGKFSSRNGWRRFVRWLYELEYGIFKIPQPTLNFIFFIPTQLSQRMSGKEDIHERDAAHLRGALRSYQWLCEDYPRRFTPIQCAVRGQFRSVQEIHEEIWKKAAPLIP